MQSLFGIMIGLMFFVLALVVKLISLLAEIMLDLPNSCFAFLVYCWIAYVLVLGLSATNFLKTPYRILFLPQRFVNRLIVSKTFEKFKKDGNFRSYKIDIDKNIDDQELAVFVTFKVLIPVIITFGFQILLIIVIPIIIDNMDTISLIWLALGTTALLPEIEIYRILGTKLFRKHNIKIHCYKVIDRMTPFVAIFMACSIVIGLNHGGILIGLLGTIFYWSLITPAQ